MTITRWVENETLNRRGSSWTVVTISNGLAWTVMAVALTTGAAFAETQNGLRSNRPMGFFGEGHEANHAHYNGLRNAAGTSCCNGADCRPTQAHWNGSSWDIMIDGHWRVVPLSQSHVFITPSVFAAQHRDRWDEQAHVCTSKDGSIIRCIIPPGPGG